MDPAVVVDASVWVSWLIQRDANHTLSDAWITQYIAHAGRLVEPVLLLSEVAGAVSRLLSSTAAGQQSITRLLVVPELQVMPIDDSLGRAAAQAAALMSLRGADAIYVALAQSLNIPLITWDAEQQQRTVGHITTYTPANYVF